MISEVIFLSSLLVNSAFGFDLPSWATMTVSSSLPPSTIVGLANYGLLGPPLGVPATLTVPDPNALSNGAGAASPASSGAWGSGILNWFGAGSASTPSTGPNTPNQSQGPYISFVSLSAKRMQTMQYYAEVFSATWLLFVILVLVAVAAAAYSKSRSGKVSSANRAQVLSGVGSKSYLDSKFIKGFMAPKTENHSRATTHSSQAPSGSIMSQSIDTQEIASRMADNIASRVAENMFASTYSSRCNSEDGLSDDDVRVRQTNRTVSSSVRSRLIANESMWRDYSSKPRDDSRHIAARVLDGSDPELYEIAGS